MWYFMFSEINAGVFLLIYDKPSKQILPFYILYVWNKSIIHFVHYLRSRIKNIQIVTQRLKWNIYKMHMGINYNVVVII